MCQILIAFANGPIIPLYVIIGVILLALILLNDHLGKLARHELTVVELMPLINWIMGHAPS